MDTQAPSLVRLAEFAPGGTAEFFARLARRERRVTRDGKPYFRVTFQDATGDLPAMIWHNSPFFEDCDTLWKKGETFRIRGRFSESKFGPQIELLAVRATQAADQEDGFCADDLFQSSRVDPVELFENLIGLAKVHIAEPALQSLVINLCESHRDDLLRWPAASGKHHAYPGGYLEHVSAVTRTAVFLAESYQRAYAELALSKDLVVAGAILHDIGKLVELDGHEEGSEYTPAGRLLGHMLLGRDLLRDFAREIPGLDDETLLRLEHIVITHQGRPEWGSPLAPCTPEAFLVHMADSVDAQFHIMATAITAPQCEDSAFTSRENPLRRAFYRGQPAE